MSINSKESNRIQMEVALIKDRMVLANENLNTLLSMNQNGEKIPLLGRMIMLAQVTEFCRHMLYSIKRITVNDFNQAKERDLLLTAIESLKELDELLKSKSIDTDKALESIKKVSTIFETLS